MHSRQQSAACDAEKRHAREDAAGAAQRFEFFSKSVKRVTLSATCENVLSSGAPCVVVLAASAVSTPPLAAAPVRWDKKLVEKAFAFRVINPWYKIQFDQLAQKLNCRQIPSTLQRALFEAVF
jgi:hypothetical protein